MSDLTTTMSKEEQAKADALLAQVTKRIETGIAEYLPGAVAPVNAEIEAIKKSQMSAEERIKAIETLQRKLDQEYVDRKNAEQLTYNGIWQDARAYRHRKGIEQPAGGRVFVAFLNSICNSVDGNMSSKKLAEFETKQGIQFPELQESFKAMGFTKSILTIGSPQEAGFIVPTPLSLEWIEALYAQLFFSKVGIRRLAMPNANMRMPRVGAKATATYTGEAAAVAKTGPKMELIEWIARKLGGLIAYSRDLFFAAPIGIENIIMDDMSRVMNLKMEYTSLYGTGTSGIPSGVNVLIPDTQKLGSSSTAFTRDIPFQLLAKIESTNIIPNFAWVMHPQLAYYIMNLKSTTGQFIYRDEMAKGTLCGYPFAKTTQSLFTDTGTYSTSSCDIWLANWSELIMAIFRDMEVTVSDQGTFVDDSGATISALERDLMLIRFIHQHDFNIRHTEAFLKGTYKLAES